MLRTLAVLLFLTLRASAQDVHVRVSPDVSTGIAGPDAFPTIQNALDHHAFAPRGYRVIIEIAPGTYHERINVTRNHENITLLGKGARPEDTIITGSVNAKQAGGTFFTAIAEIEGDGFEADNLTIQNTAGNTGQAVAAAVRADRAIFKHVRLLGHQDTLFADFGRQLYIDSYITGGVDYIFGNATAVFERCTLASNGPGYVTAQSRTSAAQATGYVIVDSRVISALAHDEAPADAGTPPTKAIPAGEAFIGLGRPWRPYSRVIYLNTELSADVRAVGWDHWGKASNEATAYYAEYGSKGPGAKPAERASWTHQLTAAEAKQYAPAAFLAGKDHWAAEAEASRLP